MTVMMIRKGKTRRLKNKRKRRKNILRNIPKRKTHQVRRMRTNLKRLKKKYLSYCKILNLKLRD
jgi:hypothetical protein